jgi:hypothetical protein
VKARKPVVVMRNYTTHIVAGEIVAVRENGDRRPSLFRRTGETNNVRAIASADAVTAPGYDGLLDVIVEDRRIILQEPYAGIIDRYTGEEFVDTAFVTFEQVEAIFDEPANE